MFLIKVFLFFCYCFSGKSILLSLAPFSLGQAIQRNFENKRKHSDSANEERESGEEQNPKRRKENKEKPHQCDVCKETFNDRFILDLHQRIHSGEKAHECDVCRKICYTTGNLVIHKRTHTGEKPYTCNVCQKVFTQNSNLSVHKRIHSGEKRYECTFCNRSFTQKITLLNHERTHTGVKPYQCDICWKMFPTISNLIDHKRRHRGERPYQCDLCGKRFPQSRNLRNHKKRHLRQEETQAGQESNSTRSKEVCDQCGKEYSSLSALRVHYQIHLGEKPYECKFCQKKFIQMDDWRKHERRHDTGEEAYECEFCQKEFSQKSGCTRHKKRSCKKNNLSGEEMYECHKCGKKFKEKISLKWHEKKHPKEKEKGKGLKCFSCDKSFVLRGVLAVHIKTHIKKDIEASLCQILCLEDQSEKGPCIEVFSDRIGVFFHRCMTHSCTKNIDEKRLIEFLKEKTFDVLRDLIRKHLESIYKESIKKFLERNKTISTTFSTMNVDKNGEPLLLCEPFDRMGKLFEAEALLLEDMLNLLLEIRRSFLKPKNYYSLKEYEGILIDLSNKRLSDQELALFLKILFDLFYENPVPEQIINVLNVNVMNQSA